ncbi:glutaminyl-peptide cyclotransferase-like protein [Mycena albidolilacea]|uniref:Peptide hydrolase n=1 Tax=Mycena albidolilacea TaxID=1033008 RepID=A0AAD6Z8G0_9AGAR|nr:glutaminyl-peptide cyclotransferase-like protein [Mycena albidolilacea]
MLWLPVASLPRALLLFLLALPSPTLQRSTLGERDFAPLSAAAISTLVSSPDPLKQLDPKNPSSHLSKILIPRVPDTANNTLVRNYIVEKLENLKWHVELDAFDDQTPHGQKHFVNIIATKDPKAARRVIVAAHFDSKYFPEPNNFVGATDSAAPCAMMLDLAEALDPLLDERALRLTAGMEEDEDVSDTTLQLVFFDGEEAFVAWTGTDFTYGARHLADKWATTYALPNSKRRLMGPQATEISGIEHLILLDLLGAENPLIRSYTIDTAWLFDALVSVEKRLGESGAFAYGDEQGMAPEKWSSFFYKRTAVDVNMGGVGDDHVPFLERGVDILHLIATPFPVVWHTVRDDASALHMPTMRRWNIMFRVFMSEYLNLRPDEKSRSQTAIAVERSETELRAA